MSPNIVLMNDFTRQWSDTGSDSLRAVERIGQSGWYVLGREVASFEAALAEFCGVRHAVGCANGLDAIEIALRALGLQQGQKVLTTPLSAFATTLAIVRAGGQPVFVDIDESGNLSLDEAERTLAADRDIKFMVPVHLFGHSLALDRLQALRERFDLRIVEDAAQAIGASFKGRKVGSVAQVTTLSFYPTKNLGALGDGGALLTDDPALAKRFMTLRDYGQSAKYVHDTLGLNSRLDELHAAILNQAMLPRLAAWLQRRCDVATRYVAGIRSDLVKVVEPVEGAASAWHLFPVRVRNGERDSLISHLKAHGIQSGIHYPHIIPDQPALADSMQFSRAGPLVVARAFAADEVSLPINPYLMDAEVDRVIEAVNTWVTS